MYSILHHHLFNLVSTVQYRNLQSFPRIFNCNSVVVNRPKDYLNNTGQKGKWVCLGRNEAEAVEEGEEGGRLCIIVAQTADLFSALQPQQRRHSRAHSSSPELRVAPSDVYIHQTSSSPVSFCLFPFTVSFLCGCLSNAFKKLRLSFSLFAVSWEQYFASTYYY